MRWLRYRLEAIAATVVFAVLAILPRPVAAAIGGGVAGAIGPWLPVSAVARRNLARALPDLDARARARVIAGMWDNLGRVVAEYPHLGSIAAADIEVVGLEHLGAQGGPVLFVSAHYGNWEVGSLAAARAGFTLHHVYRPANNPRVEAMVQAFRRATGGRYHRKGLAGTKDLVAAIRAGESLAIMADQKLNEGIALPFFGRPAMTPTLIADLAGRFGLPVVLARVERLPGARFQVILEPPMTGTADGPALLGAINARLEDWIRARPDHWLWLHRRWGD